jgi:O-antigen/teichoic acid export membrane protein
MLVRQGQFRLALRAKAHTAVSAGYALAVLAGMALLVARDAATVTNVLWMQCAAASAVAVVAASALRQDIDWRLDAEELRAMLSFSLPLVPAGVAVFATGYVHRFVLNGYAGLEQAGLFGAAARVAALATLVLIGVQSALTPLIYAHHAEPATPARLARLFEGFCGVAALVCLALTLFGPALLSWLTTPDYAAAAPLLVWLAPAALLGQMYIFAPGIPLAKKTGWQLALTVSAATLGLLAAAFLVPRWQALGAAVASLVGAAAFLGAWIAFGQRLYPLPLRWGRLAAGLTAYLAATLLIVR